MTGLEIADLREVHILRHLKDEEMSAIKSVHVYGSNRSPFDGPSALYVTTNDEVFLAGFDSLVGKSSLDEVSDGRKGILEGSVKVEELSGKSVQRIVVGEEFGAALTAGKDLYMWGADVGFRKLPAGLSKLALESRYDGAQCSKCSQILVPDEYDPSLSWCRKCGGAFQNRVSSLPPPSSWTGRRLTVLGCSVTAAAPQLPNLFCLKCRVFKGCYFETINQFEVVLCSTCYRLIDGHQYMIPPQNSPSPHKITFPTPLSIVDISAGKNFLLLQTSTKLIVWGDLGGQKYNHAIINPDNVALTKVTCGAAHIAVITNKGDLYTCGVGDEGQLGYTWSAANGCMTLNKVTLKERAVDVACGLMSTVCLLQNGTYVPFGSVTKIFTSGTWTLNLLKSALLPVPHAGFHDKIMKASLNLSLELEARRLVMLTGDLVDAFIIFCGLKSEGSRVAAPSITAVHPSSQQTDLDPYKTLGSDDAEYLNDGCQMKSKLEEMNGGAGYNNLRSSKSEYQDSGSQTEHELQQKLARAESDSPSSPVLQSSNLPHLFGKSLLSDLTLKLADADFPVHRLALHSFSAYFSQLFSDSETSAVLDMSSYNPSAYRGLLQYFYGVPLGQMTCEDMFDLYVLATTYNEDWVAADVFSKLKTSINNDSVLLLLDKSTAANATQLQKECQKFINTPEFRKSLFDCASANMTVLTELLRVVSMSKK